MEPLGLFCRKNLRRQGASPSQGFDFNANTGAGSEAAGREEGDGEKLAG